MAIFTKEQIKKAIQEDGISDYDMIYMSQIIREGEGSWFAADLMRCLHILLPHADGKNTAKLTNAFPGAVMAYRIWYENPIELAQLGEMKE